MRLIDHPDCNPQCRACHYKGLTYAEQLVRKEAWAQQQLVRWSAQLHPLIPAPEPERVGYRSKTWLRAHVVEGRVEFGMLRAVQRDGKWEEEFVSWDRCPLHRPEITQILRSLAGALERHAPKFLEHSLMGVWVGTPHLVLVSRDGRFEELSGVDWSQVLVAPFVQIWTHHNPQVGRRVFSHHPIVPLASLGLGGQGDIAASSAHPIRAFRQVAQTLLQTARAQAVQALMRNTPAQVVDLYCGTGDLALLLPTDTQWLGIELSSEAVRFANALGKQRSGDHRAFVGAVEHRLGDPQVRAHVHASYALYINPPRTGMVSEARAQLAALFETRRPRSIAYLSCSASSLARDLEFLEQMGFTVTSLQPYDFFPQTEHFETLALLEPRSV